MLHKSILKVTKFPLPPPKRLSTVVKNILVGNNASPPPPPMSNRVNRKAAGPWIATKKTSTLEMFQKQYHDVITVTKFLFTLELLENGLQQGGGGGRGSTQQHRSSA